MPDILELFSRITCLTLCLRGDWESTENYPAEAFQARPGKPCKVDIIPNRDHFYPGRAESTGGGQK